MSVRRFAVLFSLGLAIGPLNGRRVEALPQEGAAQPQQIEYDAEMEAQVREIASKLRCPTCRALSVQDSPSGMAKEMRDLVREQLQSGKTPDEVTAYFVERYGEWILLKPTASGFNWTVWLLPVLMLGGGLFFVFLTARRWVEAGKAQVEALGDDVDGGEI